MKFEDAQKGYANLWAKMTIKPEAVSQARAYATKLAKYKTRYQAVAEPFHGMPWWFVAIIHEMEGDADFSTHLHNGDPLTARTVHEPSGRPAVGSPPFTWEESAADALRLKELGSVTDWSVPRALFELERYNGWGYVGKINSPYLWAKTSLEEPGKYIADHVWSATAVSKQWGAAAILRAMMDLKIVENLDPMSDLKDFLKQFAGIAPMLVTAIAGPVPGLAVRALAEALTNETSIDTGGTLVPADPTIITEKLKASPITSIFSVIQAAEQIIRIVGAVTPPPIAIPAPAPAPVPVLPPAETTTTVIQAPAPTTAAPDGLSVLDKLFPSLVGWKTYIAIAFYVAGNIGAIFAPTLVTPEVLQGITWLAGGIGGAGLLEKMDRYIAIFKPSVKTTVVKTS